MTYRLQQMTGLQLLNQKLRSLNKTLMAVSPLKADSVHPTEKISLSCSYGPSYDILIFSKLLP